MSLHPKPGSVFIPRREFMRDQRLYSFPPLVTTALHRLFDHYQISLSIRVVATQNLYEFTLDGKPWANVKSLTTEKLLMDIFVIIYQSGYTYLSNLDYGRESDDLLVVAFSKPSSSSSPSPTGTPLPPTPQPPTPHLLQSTYSPRSKQVPFALSFTSTTCMRVISPPLHLTPAILQAVRASWPRGVVSEKKVGDNSFEFKLKGYKWFEQDSFATDSLQHILALLSSLDAQSFTLLSSISLKNRSRVKDLWVFTGPAPSSEEDAGPQESPNVLDSSYPDRGYIPEAIPDHYPTGNQDFVPQHRRVATEPTLPSQVHVSTEDHRNMLFYGRRKGPKHVITTVPPSVLRKPPPRAQVPVSVANELETSTEGVRANLPSTVSSSVENMTGVGTTRFFPESLHAISRSRDLLPGTHPQSPNEILPATAPNRRRNPPHPVSRRAPPISVSNSRSPQRPNKLPPPVEHSVIPENIVGSSKSHTTPPLLGPGAFRDSLSSTGYVGSDSLKWAGETQAQGSLLDPPPSKGYMLSYGPERTPEERRGFVMNNHPTISKAGAKTVNAQAPIYEVISHTTPELSQPDARVRKSETAVVGEATATSPPLHELPKNRSPRSPDSLDSQGWVLVNLSSDPQNGRLPSSMAQHSRTGIPQLTSANQAKAVAIMGTVNTNKGKLKAKQGVSTAPPTKKRLFGLGGNTSKKNSHQ